MKYGVGIPMNYKGYKIKPEELEGKPVMLDGKQVGRVVEVGTKRQRENSELYYEIIVESNDDWPTGIRDMKELQRVSLSMVDNLIGVNNSSES